MCTASLTCSEQKLSNNTSTELIPLDSLETGDVLLYRTKDIGACFNAWAGWSYYSHVSVVIRGDPEVLRSLYPDDYKNCDRNSCLAIFESVPNRGVALFPLKARLARTVKSIHHLSMRRRVGPTVTKQQQLNLEAFVRLVLGRDLEILTLDLVRVAVGRHCASCGGNSTENWNKFYCSELVAEALQQLGIIRENGVNSNDFLPASFAGQRNTSDVHVLNKKRMHFLDDVCLPENSYQQEEILITRGCHLVEELLDFKRELRARKDRKSTVFCVS